tara:strand:- start:1804 stop:4695 length:2892 start_codon:yes stop_codon:yes gene_type:complete
MTIGTTTINSRLNITNQFTVNDDLLIIDNNGNLTTSGNSRFNGRSRFDDTVTLNNGITSANNSIILTPSGALTLESTIFSGSSATFTNSLIIRDKNSQPFVRLDSNDNSYIIHDNYLGIGTDQPEYYFHVNGNIYSNDSLTVKNKVTINPNGFNNENFSAYTLNVGGDINITGRIHLNGEVFSPEFMKSALEQLKTFLGSSSSGDSNETGEINASSNNGNFSITSHWTKVNNQLYVTNLNVGIGTLNPQYTLDVRGDAFLGGDNTRVDLNGSVYYNNRLLDDIVIGLWNYSNEDKNNIYIALDEKVNIGIGTDDPSSKLHVIGDIKTSNISISQNALIANKLGVGTTNPAYMVDINGDLRVSGIFYINGKPYEEAVTQNVFWMLTNTGNNIYWMNNVGLGTNNPQYKLHIVGDLYTTGTVKLDADTETENLNINNTMTFKKDKIVIKNNGDIFTKGIFYSNNINGDIQTNTLFIKNNKKYLNYIPNTNLIQEGASIFNNSFNAIGTTNSGTTISTDGSLIACLVPYGTKTVSNETHNNGVIQTYKWDSYNNTWYLLDDTASTSITGRGTSSSYGSSIVSNKTGDFIGLSVVSTSSYKAIFFVLGKNTTTQQDTWTIRTYINDILNADAGKYLIMQNEINYLLISESLTSIRLYTNTNMNSSNSNSLGTFVKSSFSTGPINNIGTIDDLKCNEDCSIFLLSSSTGANSSNYKNGTIACYTTWNLTGRVSTTNKNSFIRLGKNITELNTQPNKYSRFGKICTIASKASLDFTNVVNANDVKYNNMRIAISTGGELDPNNSRCFIKIYEFSYNKENISAGLITEDNVSYVDGSWNELVTIDHVSTNALVSFGTDIKLNNDGTIIYIGSPVENNIYVMSVNENDPTDWKLINKIQGFKSSDVGLGFRLNLNEDNNIFLSTCLNKIRNTNHNHSSSEYNNIKVYKVEDFTDQNDENTDQNDETTTQEY